MANSATIGELHFAHRNGLKPNDCRNGLHNSDHFSVLSAIAGAGFGHLSPSPQGEEARHVSFLANLLTPLTGKRSEQIASQIINQYGSLSNAMQAAKCDLAMPPGLDADIHAVLHGARNLVEASIHERLRGSPVSASDPNLHCYLQLKLSDLRVERLHVVFLGESGRYLRDETIAKGSAGKVETRLRPLFKRALELGATGIILAHNHPSGRAEPSSEDVQVTRQISSIASALELRVVDHLILAGRQVYSMQQGGVLRR